MLRDFYKAVLPQTGHFCLVKLPQGTHEWAQTQEQLIDRTLAHKDERGIYFAVEGFKTDESRKQSNVLALRALRLDIDAGAEKFARDPEGVYESRQEALVALRGFIGTSGIKPGYLVSSGQGWHVYYCLSTDASPEQWLPLSRRLQALCASAGLRTDTTVTCDSARVLRPLGTLHKNGNRVKAVLTTGKTYSIDELSALLPAEAKAPKRKYDTSINADVIVESAPKSIHKILEHCGALQEVNTAKGDVPEPFWRAMLGVVKFTVEGLDAAQELSRGHADYDEDKTERKFNAWATGPTSCEEFSRHSKACATCGHKGNIKSPILLGYLTAKQVEQLPVELQPTEPVAPAPTGDPWDNCLPPRFRVTKGNPNTLECVFKAEKETETGEMAEMTQMIGFTHDIFWLGQWTEADTSDSNAQVTLHLLSGKHIRNYIFDQGLVACRSELLKFLGNKAIHITTHPKAGICMENYIRGQLLRIKSLGKRPTIRDRLGLRIEENGELVAVHGKYYIQGDGTIQDALLDKGPRSVSERFCLPLPATYSGSWGKSVWADILTPAAARYAAFVRKYYAVPGLEKYQLAIMLGLTSPLMPFITGSYARGTQLPPNGFSVSLFSRESGRGKTAVVKVIMMAYGNKELLVKDSNELGSTDLARSGKLSLWGTMPMSMDEMGGTKEKAISDMISMVGNGAARERLNKEGVLSSSAPWALMNMITTNRSQRDMIAAVGTDSNAVQERLLELNVDNIAKFDTSEGGSLDTYNPDASKTDDECAGAMGAVIQYWICRQGPAAMNAIVLRYVNKARQLLGGVEQGERYQFRALGAMLTLQAMLARLGLTMFDTAELVSTFKSAYEAGEEFVKETHTPTSGPELLAKMLSDVAPRTLVTASETHLGRNGGGFDVPSNLRVPDKPVARHITDLGRTYVSTAEFRAWCADNKVSEREIVSECRAAELLLPFPHWKVEAKPCWSEYYNFHKGMRDSADARCRCMLIDTRRLLRYIGADWDAVLPETDGKVVSIGQKASPAEGSEPPMQEAAA